MGLRFPNGILYLRAASDINRATGALVKSESVVSSGKSVQKISDDPSAATRIIALNREILNNQRFLSTIGQGEVLLNTGASSMQTISDIVVQAKQLAIQGENQTLTQQDRDALADQVDGLLGQALAIANQQVNGRYIFGGSRTDIAPYSIDTISGQKYAVYKGNKESLSLLVNFGVSLGVTVPGPQVFQETGTKATLFKGSTGAAVGTGQNTGTNNDTLLVTHGTTTYSAAWVTAGASSAAGDTVIGALATHTLTVVNGATKTLSLDGGPAVTFTGAEADLKVTNASGDAVFVNTTGIGANSGVVNITSTGFLSTDNGTTTTAITYGSQKIVDSVTGSLLNVNSAGIVRTGSEYVTYQGTFDLFTLLMNLRDDLKNTRNLSVGDQIQSIQDRNAQLDGVHKSVLAGLSLFGERSAQAQAVEQNLQDTQAEVQQLLSSVQDADLALAITEFAKAQAALEYTQAVASKVLSVSLLNFLK